MVKVCAWCNETMQDDAASDGAEVSHGICKCCVDKFFSRANKNLTDFLGELNVPVLLVNEEGFVLSGNHSALQKAQQDSEQLAKETIGEITDCIFALSPEGCGKTTHCSGCIIRRTIEKTRVTGEPQLEVPALQERTVAGRKIRVQLRISTMLHNGIILLRLDETNTAIE